MDKHGSNWCKMTTVKSILDLNLSITKNLHIIRNTKCDVVVGIPRSGIMTASIICTHLQLPMTDIESFLDGKSFISHGRLQPVDPDSKILLVDDSINTGRQMREAYSRIKQKFPNLEIIKFAVYSSKRTKSQDIDIVCEECPLPRAFQWNIWKHKNIREWATDMDGVLCRDPTKKENDQGGPKLLQFYKDTDEKFPIQGKIKYIITARFEKYRKVTEDWLKQHNISYGKLIMKPDDNKLTHAQYKAEIINSLNDLSLYIESSDKQAAAIAKNTSVSVWCTDSQKAYNND